MSGIDREPTGTKAFLTAEWRNIAILTYPADPALLTPLLPNGIEMDLWNGQAFLSVVGLFFECIKFQGVPLPFIRRFEQVNLRFYVRRRAGVDWRRGVVFIREFVPYRSIAAAARVLYGQHYNFAPMRHRFDAESTEFSVQLPGGSSDERSSSSSEFRVQASGCLPNERDASTTVEYSWWNSGRWNRLSVAPTRHSEIPAVGSIEEFITERHWGYARASRGGCIEFEVRRPAWLVSAGDGWLDCDAAKVYGQAFAGILSSKPGSTFLAAGSVVALGQPISQRA